MYPIKIQIVFFKRKFHMHELDIADDQHYLSSQKDQLTKLMYEYFLSIFLVS